jgi:hypothetical protein
MTCMHGEVTLAADATAALDKWKDLGEMTPLNALVVKNL